MKKGKSFLMEASYPYCPSSSSSRLGDEEEGKAWSRHHSLMEDYMELEKVVEAKRKKLLKANKKKHKLSAVVKFLRRKFKNLSKNPSRRIQNRVEKKHSPKLLLQPSVQRKAHLKDSQEVRDPTVPSITTLFDLNQIIPVEPESPRTDLSKEYVLADKRKISRQNQIAVRV